jgi:hypothetical protein
MAFNKTAIMSHKCSVRALNRPSGAGWDIFNFPNQIKTASTNVESEDLGGFDIKTAIKDHPDHLYIKIFAIKKDEPNDNGDSFSEEELEKAASTFVGVPLFTNHQNDDVEKARGECVHSWYDKKEGGIFIVGRVDKVAYPRLARGIEENYISGTSMGCSVDYSLCSVCHNKAHVADEYCLEGKTPILMSDFTTKPIEDIKIGDEVIDAYGKKTKVTQLFKREVDEKISVLKSRCINGELLVTKNHPFLVNRRGEYRYIPSEYMEDNETLFMPVPQIEKTNYFFDKFGFDYLSREDKKRLVAFLGYYAAEGSRIKKDGKIKAIELTFHEDEENYVEEVKNICIDIFKKEPSIYRNNLDRHIIRVRLWKPEVAEIIHSMCPGIIHREQSKKFDESIFSLEDEYKVELLRGFIDGDGHCDSRDIIQIVSACSSLASQILYLILSLKSSPSFNCYSNGISKKGEELTAYRISLSTSQLKSLANQGVKCSKAATKIITQSKLSNAITEDELFAKHNAYCIEEVGYKGSVYNFETESHSYVANNTSVHNCSHISSRKNRKFSGETKCSYHDSKCKPDDKCPLCGSEKKDRKTLKHAEQQIFEHNYGLKFIENSFVVNPACHECGVKCVLHVPNIQKKVASLVESVDRLIKNSNDPEFFETNAKNLVKLGGVKELQSLKNSMTEMETVVKSMLVQKENVSMEYVSDLVKAMAEVQAIYDELNEMGYGALPSPNVTAGSTEPIQTFPQPVPPPTPTPASPQSGSVETQDMGGLGNVTLPRKSSKIKEDFSKNSESLINRVSSLEQSIRDFVNKSDSQLRMGAKMITDKNTKVAAGVDNLEVITEKQLEKKDETLHPRTDTVYEQITESKEQLGGGEKSNDTTSTSPQVRAGTYDTITEDQLKTKSALGDAVIHFNEYPDVITEKQWNDFSRQIAANIPAEYTEQITQAQIRDLLAKHKFIGNVETITEDQLKGISMTDGLKRWAHSSYVNSLIKVATDIVADLISVYRKSPQEIKEVVSTINDNSDVKNKISFLTVVNSLPQKKGGLEALSSKARYFSKTASTEVLSTVDALIMSAAQKGQLGQRVEDVLDFVHDVVNDKKAMQKVESMIKSRSEENNTALTRADAFAKAVKFMDRPEDGKYKIKATIEEAGVNISDKVAFCNGVKKYAQEMIDDPGVAAAVIKIEVGENGELVIDVQDTNVGAADEITPEDIGEVIEGPVEDIDADINGEEQAEGTEEVPGTESPTGEEEAPEENPFGAKEEEEKDMTGGGAAAPAPAASAGGKVASAKKEIKKAQMMGGEMGGQGGAAQGPGAGATMPSPAAAATPPVESFTDDEAAGDEMGTGDDEGSEPLPPGSICPVCGSEDVDIVAGKGKCNNCNSEMTYKVEINVTKWQGVTPDEEDIAGGEDEFSGEGFEMPTEEEMGGAPAGAGAAPGGAAPGGAAPEMPAVAAMTRLKPEALKKLAEMKIDLGSVSPATGKTNTVKLADGEYVCLDTGIRYKVAFVVSPQDPKKGAYAQWTWTPRVASIECPSCARMKQNFIKALSSIKMKKADFDALDMNKQIEVILQLKKAGALKQIKIASKNGSVMEDMKLSYGNWGNKFPMESCLEKLSRRFGENAVCLSGPDEGKPLASSICNRLKKADIYTDRVAIKLAESWSDCDGDEECITHQVRNGHDLREAASICNTLKSVYAQASDFLADDMDAAGPEGGMTDDTTSAPMGEATDDIGADVDPFAGDIEGGETVTLTLPKEVVEQLSQEVSTALEGGSPEGDAGAAPTEDAPITDEVPGEAPMTDGAPGGAIEEQIAPGDLTEKPAAPAPTGSTSATESVDPAKPCTNFEAEKTENCGGMENNEGNPEKASNVTVTVNGKPTDGPADTGSGFGDMEAMAMYGGLGKIGKPQMDLSSVVAAISKKADKEISQQKAQDSKDIGSYSAGEKGSLMGHENETIRTPQKPSVPRDLATMGQEPSDLNPQDKPQPKIPSGDALMGHEREIGLSGGDDRYTGGDKGQGKTELASQDEDLYHMRGFRSSKKGLSELADRIAEKLAPKAPVADDADVKPFSGDSKIGKEEEIKAEEVKESTVKSDGGFIGHEKKTLESKPDSPKDHPDVFTGNAQMGKEELDSEKTTKDKGTVIATSDSESEAFRVAARMIQAKKLDANELQKKIAELKQYKPEQIRDLENAIFAKKGLDSVSDGLTQSIQINENSSVKNAHEDLTKQLQSMFTLGRQNKWAENDETSSLRRVFNK